MSEEIARIDTKLHLAIVIDDMGGGGAESFVLTIIESLLKRDYKIDLVLFKFRGPRLLQIPDGLNLFVLDKHFDREKDAEQCSVPAEQIQPIDYPVGIWKNS